MVIETQAQMEGRDLSTSWHSYPSIRNFGHAEVRDVLAADVNVEEKVDGSQFSFGMFGGKLRCRSKGREIPLDEGEVTDKLFAPAVATVQALFLGNFLRDGWAYRGETLAKPKHNALTYDRVPAGHIIVFDINPGHEAYLPYDEKEAEAARLDLETVPLLFRGHLTKAMFDQLLETESVLGGPKIEGIVIKPIEPVYGRDAKALMAKFVSEAFREVHKKEWGDSPRNSNKSALQILQEMFNTEARWVKAVQHLRDQGSLLGTPQDIGALIAEVKRDCWEEEQELIAQTLLDAFEKDFTRGLGRGLPQWYKDRLVTETFEAETPLAFVEAIDEHDVTGED